MTLSWFFISFKEYVININNYVNRLLKEINRLLSKGMSDIYLEVTIDKK